MLLGKTSESYLVTETSGDVAVATLQSIRTRLGCTTASN